MRLTRHLIASAIILVTNSSAWAATTNMDFPSYVSGYATLELSDAVLDTANIGAAQFSSVSPGVADLVDSQGSYLQASFSLPATALAYDDVTKEVLSLSTTGGYRVNAGNVAGIQGGGWFEVSGLTIDFSTQSIIGTIEGQSSSGVAVSYTGDLFNALSMTYNPDTWQAPLYSLQLNGLALNPLAFNAMLSSLDGGALLKVALAVAAADYGSLSVGIADYTLDPPDTLLFTPPSMAVAVPEPATWILMGIGVVGLMLTTRRKIRSEAH